MLDSGCTQYMTGDPRMFNSINENKSNGIDSITFGDNGKGKVLAVSNCVDEVRATPLSRRTTECWSTQRD